MEPNQIEESESTLLPVETSLLYYTLKNLADSNAHLITQCKEEMKKHNEQQMNRGDQIDEVPNEHGELLMRKLDMLEWNQRQLESASDETSLIKHMLAYRELLESAVIRTRLRYERLSEEHAWLQEELEHFESQSAHEEQRAKQLREKIAHYAFIYHQRRSWAEQCIPAEMCGLPRDSGNGQEPGRQIEQTIAQMRSKVPVLHRIPGNLTDSLITDFDNETSQDSEELTDLDDGYHGIERHHLTDMSQPTEVSEALNGNNKTTEDGDSSSSLTVDRNASNSAKMTLSELRDLMLGDNNKDAKKATDVTATLRRMRMGSSREKVSKLAREFMQDSQLSDLEKETLKQCMKTMDRQIQLVTPTPRSDVDGSLEEAVEQFIRSPQRTQNLAAFVDLIHQFNHKETHSPGISLCWLAIASLRRYERELRLNDKANAKHGSPSRAKRSHRGCSAMFTPGTWEEVEYRNVLDDLCRLLSIVAHLYWSRNEMPKAAECLKDMLKLRRTTHTWKQASVAQALSDLASIQSNLKECNAALANARKSLQLRRDMLAADQSMVEQSQGEFSVAKQATSLALMLMHKHQTEQKKLRYHRFPFRDVAEIPTLLNEAIRIESTLTEYAAASGLSLTSDWRPDPRERPSKTLLGDCRRGRDHVISINPVEECLMIARNALAVYYVSTKKWTKAQKHLTQNLAHVEQFQPDEIRIESPNRASLSLRMIKLICLKCLLHVYRMTGQTKEQEALVDRVSKLDPFYRNGDELNEDEMIRFCQTCLFKSD